MTIKGSQEMGVRDARKSFPALVNAAAVRGTITYLTNHGRRVAAIVPLDIAEAAEVEVSA